MCIRDRVRGFDYLALCSAGGDFQTLYGQSIQPLNPEPFVEALVQGKQRVAVGVDSAGDKVVLFGVDAAYPMHNGERGTGLIAVSYTHLYQTFALILPSLLVFALQGCDVEVLPYYKQAVKALRLGYTAGGWRPPSKLGYDILRIEFAE